METPERRSICRHCNIQRTRMLTLAALPCCLSPAPQLDAEQQRATEVEAFYKQRTGAVQVGGWSGLYVQADRFNCV